MTSDLWNILVADGADFKDYISQHSSFAQWMMRHLIHKATESLRNLNELML